MQSFKLSQKLISLIVGFIVLCTALIGFVYDQAYKQALLENACQELELTNQTQLLSLSLAMEKRQRMLETLEPADIHVNGDFQTLSVYAPDGELLSSNGSMPVGGKNNLADAYRGTDLYRAFNTAIKSRSPTTHIYGLDPIVMSKATFGPEGALAYVMIGQVPISMISQAAAPNIYRTHITAGPVPIDPSYISTQVTVTIGGEAFTITTTQSMDSVLAPLHAIRTQVISIACLLIAALIMGVFWFQSHLALPFGHILHAMRTIALGKGGVPAVYLERRDEVGALARAVEMMGENTKR